MKDKCPICGYEYNETKEGIAFSDLSENWQCPWCKASKLTFEPVGETAEAAAPVLVSVSEVSEEIPDESMLQLSIGQMAALCSNLARGCEKQYMSEEHSLFNELSEWFTNHSPKVEDATVESIAAQLQQDIAGYPQLKQTCALQGDRGAQRVLTWSEKATRMLSSLMTRYQREGDALLADNEIWVCSVCGFVYIGKNAPELCPICKAPSWKFNKIERRIKL